MNKINYFFLLPPQAVPLPRRWRLFFNNKLYHFRPPAGGFHLCSKQRFHREAISLACKSGFHFNNTSHHLSHAGVDFILQKARFHHEVISLISQVMNLIGESLYHCQRQYHSRPTGANITALAQ